MQSMQIAEAYVQFGTKGDVGPATEKQASRAKQFAEKEAQAKMKWGERFVQHQKQATARVEQFRQQEERTEKMLANQKTMRIMKSAALMKTAFGAVPGMGAAADIAMAGAMGGGMGAAAMGAGKAIGYGMGGAAKASPGTMERFQYQQDRFQAILGSKLVPAIDKMTSLFEKMGDAFGGKGAQLGMPQFSSFTEARDRLQMQAGQGMGTSGGNGRTIGALLGTGIGTLIGGPFGMGKGAEIGGNVGEKVEKAFDSVWEGSWLQKQKRGLSRDIF